MATVGDNCVEGAVGQTVQNGVDVQEPRHPEKQLLHLAKTLGLDITDKKFALKLDEEDEVSHLRKEFFYPKKSDLPYGKLLVGVDSLVSSESQRKVTPKHTSHYITYSPSHPGIYNVNLCPV